MKRGGLMFLLLSSCVLVCHLQPEGLVRQFYFIGMMNNWTEAQQYCREKFTDLATIQDSIQNTVAQQAAASGQIWIGHFKSDWRWSLDNEELSKETSFTSWDTTEPKLTCATISEHGSWSTRDCGWNLFPVCYHAEHSTHRLIRQKMMTWSESQAFCRSMFTDLSTIRNAAENEAVTLQVQTLLRDSGQDGSRDSSQDSNEDSVENRVEINLKDSDESGGDDTNIRMNQFNIWMGLHRNFWMWSDQDNVSFVQWAPEQSDDVNARCTKMDSTAKWFAALCSEKHFFLCYSDHRPSMMRTVKVRVSGGSADLNDPTVQGSILEQLKQRMEEAGIREEVKLRWRESDGKVFHREEEERAPPACLEEKTVCDSLVGKPTLN